MQTNCCPSKAQQCNTSAQPAKVELEPFERGYGHTLGNAICGVLLSSMVGYAATEVTIAGSCCTSTSSIDGVQEDVVNIPLNLKGVVFKLHNRDEVTEPAQRRRRHRHCPRYPDPHDVEIINPDHVIATCRRAASWTCRSRWRRAAATCPGNLRRYSDESTKSIGRIVLDARSPREARELHRGKRPWSSVPTWTSWWSRSKPTARSLPKTPCAHRPRFLVEQLAVFAQLEGGELADRFDAPGPTWQCHVRSDPAASRGRAGTDRAFCQLPEGGEHLLHR